MAKGKADTRGGKRSESKSSKGSVKKPDKKSDKKSGKKAAKAAKSGKSARAAGSVKAKVAAVVASAAEAVEREPVEPPEPAVVDFWFDPACPWAWLTSRWMLEVEKVRPVKTVFHVMSLAVLNHDREVSDGYRQFLNGAWAAVRVALGVERDYGQEQLAAFYAALGTRYHPGGEPRNRETIEHALTDIGVPIGLAELGETGDWDDDLRASHHRGMEAVGDDVGTPVLQIGGSAIFGPVVTPCPTGEDAGRLFDAVSVLTRFPGFYELKRSRTEGPTFG